MNTTSRNFIITLSLIILIGIIMVYSSSYIYSKEVIGSSTHFLAKQLMFLLIGGSAAFVLSKTKFQFWIKSIYPLHVIITILLILTLSGFGDSVKGSSRWLTLFGFGFQPGEFLKLSMLLSSLRYFSNFINYTKEERVKLGALLSAPLLALILQPDFGTFGICLGIMFSVAFLSEFPRRYFYSSLLIALSAAAVIMVSAPYRVKRLMTFIDPWSDPQNTGFQIIQSYLAFANGYIFGSGIGNSNEKLFYLPEAHNDFIFSVLGEELGFVGVIFVVVLYVTFMLFGFRLSFEPYNRINKMFIACAVFLIGFQALVNMSVVLGLLPTKGLNLPFISYGGSSLLSNLVLIGLIFSAKNIKSNDTPTNINSYYE